MSSDPRATALEPGDEVLDQLQPDEAPTAGPTLWQRLADSPNVAITLVALLVFGFFALTTDTFLTEFNLINILRNAALIGIVAVGMTYLLIAGEIDLSVGSVFGFLTVIMGLLVVELGVNPWLAMVGVIAHGHIF
jgi:ribose transport system permease protein